MWAPDEPGVVVFPSGRSVRGRSLKDPPRSEADFSLLLGSAVPVPWDHRLVRWRDFSLPADRDDARAALVQTWARAQRERVEVACRGGRGRTGTALACLAILDGVPPTHAVAFVRAAFHPRAVETPWQRRHVERFEAPPM